MCLGMDYTLGCCSGTVSGVVVTGGGVSEAISRFQDPKRSRSLAISSRWLWYAVAGASLMAQERNLRECAMWYSGVIVGWIT